MGFTAYGQDARRMSAAAIWAMVLLPMTTFAQWTEEQKLLASDGAADDAFGDTISISGDVIAIGAEFDDDDRTNAGAVYVYRTTGVDLYAEQQKLTTSDSAALYELGKSVSVSGNVLMAGAQDKNAGQPLGAVCVFEYDDNTGMWMQEANTLLASDGADGNRFGLAISIAGDVALIGASGDSENGDDAGAAYIFRYDSGSDMWLEEDKLLASDGSAGDGFGSAVALSGDIAVVSAPYDNDNGLSSGAVYIFRYNEASGSWLEEQRLVGSDSQMDQQLGFSVAISGNAVICGANLDPENAYDAGAAFVFRYNDATDTWVEEVKLQPLDYAESDQFGWSVAISENLAAVGARRTDDKGTNSGSVYIFRYNPIGEKWDHERKLLGSDGAEHDNLGEWVAIDGNVVIAGAPDDDDNGDGSGSAYVFQGPNYLLGDVDHDGDLDAVDVQFVINAALGLTLPPNVDADVNLDAQINAVDVQVVINATLGVL